MVKAQYPNATDETIQRYCDLRDEGHSQYAAGLMAGLTDPPDDDQDGSSTIARAE
jgi:hypothetical protein